jgi:hypothetical protein
MASPSTSAGNGNSSSASSTSSSGDTLEKAKIVLADFRENFEIKCQFNPRELTIEKSVTWHVTGEESGQNGMTVPGRNAPDLDYGGGNPASFTLDLIFDTTQETESAKLDVRRYTNELFKLTMMGAGDKKNGSEPPHVQFLWGEIMLFMAVVEKVSVSFTHFLPNGTPVRARAKVVFLQEDDEDDVAATTNPTTRTEARKTYVVHAGDRLDLIAYQQYGHPAHWRNLAEANQIADPLDIYPGQILIVPELD